ncbi:ATP-binding protein [Mesorhizobium sp. L-2-11]|uniref:ATP-binding protein n=1 Tax=Mesorhizobium sp. L-2-11 TaxID=2744521 RepID=UPI0019264DD7|nr:ATP-binding protein [Mesorhizobium sp. L-2-11]BCH13688.1 hypothetical protein MesoLjLa_05390 [Mesorhizobium sp. L-2-11]
MAEPRRVSVQPYFGGFILETLTVGMYGESKNAIREYVQIGFDSIQRAIEELKILQPGEGLIQIIFDADADGLRIRDNGAGLSTKQAVRTLASIGASNKDYTTDAGFRGIGRLAGIVFSDIVAFTTKAAGESEATKVVFDAKEMRHLMSPARGSELSAQALLERCVSATIIEAKAEEAPYFEVSLRGFTEQPEEVKLPSAMVRFISQVAPVPYNTAFPYRQAIQDFAAQSNIRIDSVRVLVEEYGKDPVEVSKPYTARYEVQDAERLVELTGVEPFVSATKRWWGWVGRKDVPGSYVDADVRGIRVRAKNIQIDGTDVVREIFQRQAKSNARYQDWTIGEIFVDLKAVVPNARRDGFEDTKAWKEVRKEIADTVCKDVGSWAQEVSNKGQLTLQTLTEKKEKFAVGLEALRRTDFRNKDRTLTLSADVTKLQGEVARASKNAEPTTLAALQHLNSQLIDIKTEAVSQIAGSPAVDAEAVEAQARDTLLTELLVLFESHLEAPCLSAVRNVIRDEYDWPRD